MITYESSVTIDGPAGDVWPLISQVERHADWMDVEDVHSTGQGPVQVGSVIESVIRKGPARLTLAYEATELEANRRFAFRTVSGPLDWDGAFALEPAGDRTVVRSTGQIRPRGLFRLLTPLMRMELPKGEAAELVRLRELAEKSRVGRPDANR